MLKLFRIISSAAVMVLLTSCGVTMTHISQVSQEKLASGHTTNVGWLAPKPAWQCQQIGSVQSYNWAAEQFKGNMKFNG